MQISLAVFDHVEELDLVGPWEFAGLLCARGFCATPKLVTFNSMTPAGAHGLRFVADEHFSNAALASVLIVPGGRGAREAMLDPDVLSYLRTSASEGRTIMSVCTGSYLLQAAGVLAGRRAITHWAHLKHLRDDPEVILDQRRVVRDDNIWTSGGVSSGMDMMLEFIADRFGDAVAADVQLDAEYFPAGTMYGQPSARDDVTDYIKQLAQPL